MKNCHSNKKLHRVTPPVTPLQNPESRINTVFLLFFLFKFLEKGAEKGQNNYNSCNAALSVALVQECSKLVKPVPLIALE